MHVRSPRPLLQLQHWHGIQAHACHSSMAWWIMPTALYAGHSPSADSPYCQCSRIAGHISWAQTADSPLVALVDTPLGVQIVANNRNGLDVDKYDYLQRDSMYSGTKISVDVKRIFPFVKVGLPGCGSRMLRCRTERLRSVTMVAAPLCALCRDAASEGVTHACSLSAKQRHLQRHAHHRLLQASETDHGEGALRHELFLWMLEGGQGYPCAFAEPQ